LGGSAVDVVERFLKGEVIPGAKLSFSSDSIIGVDAIEAAFHHRGFRIIAKPVVPMELA